MQTFEAQTDAFTEELRRLVTDTLAEFAGSIEVTKQPERAVIELVDPQGAKAGPAIHVAGQPSVRLLLRLGLRPDSTGEFIAVTKSVLGLTSVLDRTPLFRLEYDESLHTAPKAHWQVHAERGALSHLLTLGGHDRPHQLAALHLPVGGTRMRPGIEDFLQFAVDELGVDARPGYAAILEAGRERWRRRQIATLVRDVPDEAVRVLRRLGYTVELPGDGPGPVRQATLGSW